MITTTETQVLAGGSPLPPNAGPNHCPILNPELEKTVVANLLTSGHAMADTADILFDDCFADPKMREIFHAAKEVYRQGHIPDIMLVPGELAKNGSRISALDVADLCVYAPVVVDIEPHARLLRDMALRRRLWRIGADLMARANDERFEVETIRSGCRKQLEDLVEYDNNELITLNDAFKELIGQMLENRNREPGETYGTPTGFDDIDRRGGLCPTDLVVVGAETSQGKTSFATSLAMSAISHGEGVAFYSMEMLPRQLSARIAAMRSGISSSHIQFDRLSNDEINRIGLSMNHPGASNLYFDGNTTSGLDSILTSIRRMKMKKGIKGAVVDYLQLVRPENMKQNREQAIGDIARSFKNLAKELGIWIILISQLSRDRQSTAPSLARLRDSGQIEEAADVIYLIHRPRDGRKYPEPFADVPTDGTAMISVAKGRNIGITQFICGFSPETTLFYPLSPADLAALKTKAPTGENPEKKDTPISFAYD